MLRRIGFRRVVALQPAAASASIAAVEATASLAEDANEATPEPESLTPSRGRWFTWKRAILATLVVTLASGACAYSQKERFSAQAADLSRRVIGDERTAQVEGWVFRVEDRLDQIKYRITGSEKNPFATREIQVQFVPQTAAREIVYFAGSGSRNSRLALTAEALGPLPLKLPATHVFLSEPQPGEGVWSTTGLPRNTPAETLMAKTFIRPDKARPYASVGILLVDKRRIHLNIVAGTAEPGGDRGVKGPGSIPKSEYANLLVAFNGGFKGPHGGFGMVANGREYMRMRNGLATVCVSKDRTIQMGEFGRDFTWQDNFEACRQNAILLVDKGEVSRRTTEGNDTWGYVNVDSSEFITWRSAVGITREGDLLIASGNSLSAATLAQALWAAGAHMAMQLDINGPYICTGLFYSQPDGTVKAQKFMDNMAPSASSFLGTKERDFFYLTLDDSRFK